MSHFWEGFEKRASMPGVVSGSGHYGQRSAGKVMGNRPSSGVATAAAFKPNPLPTPAPTNPGATLAPKIQTTAMPVAKQHAKGVSSMAI